MNDLKSRRDGPPPVNPYALTNHDEMLKALAVNVYHYKSVRYTPYIDCIKFMSQLMRDAKSKKKR